MTILRITDRKTNLPRANFAGFDAMRAAAAVAVVVLHALVPYLKHPMPGLVWSVSDDGSSLADVLFWSIELCVMPLFLIIAGFLAFGTYHRKGAWELTSSRAKRLLRPLLFAVLVILPIDLYVWVLGWVGEGIVPAVKLKSLKFDGVIDQHLWGLSHLWFLHYLFSYVALFALTTGVRSRWPRLVRRIPVSMQTSLPATVVVAWIVATLVIAMRPEVIWGFQHAFAPVASKWIYNGCFFAIGLAIAAADPSAMRWQALSPKWAAVAACSLATTVPLGLWSLEGTSDHSYASQAFLAVMTASTSLLASVAFVSVSLRHVRHLPVWTQYLAAASFWVYLVHHPLLAMVHIDLKWWMPGVSPMVKGILATLISLTGSLITFELLVRRSRFGQWMGMKWTMPPREDDVSEGLDSTSILPLPEAQWEPVRRAA